ncbi:MAG: N-acetylmuramoyl-L-alanine amidase [Agathobacter sp.]|nr:N-acetylmuramoyl-L-alanine amidase [Agathobacter sp.]
MKKLRCVGIVLICLLCFSQGVWAQENQEQENQEQENQAECLHTNTELRNEKPATSNPSGRHIEGYTGDLVCLDCGQILEWGTEISPATRVIVKSVTYSGKAQKPAVSVYDTNGVKINSQFYKIAYSDNTKVGYGKVTIGLSGQYAGSLNAKFSINPKKISISAVKAKRKGFTVTWKKGKQKNSGYQVQYASNAGFKKAKIQNAASKLSQSTVSKLKGGKYYYVRVRAFKKIGGRIFYSQWSKARKVKTCKYLIVIDPGHQKQQNTQLEPIGPGATRRKIKVAGGTRGVATGKYEYQLNLEVSLKLEAELKKRGYEVVLIRRTHNVNISNSQRAKIANNLKADAFIRIHANGSDSSYISGAMTLCMTQNNPYNASLYSKSYKLSSRVLSGLVKATDCKNQGIGRVDNMSGINWSKVPVTIVEMGYMTNYEEDRKMATSSYQKKIAIGIANGINSYFAK